MLAAQATPIKAQDDVKIGKQNIKLNSDLMTPEALWAMGRIGAAEANADGTQIVYQVGYYSVKANKLHGMLADGRGTGQSATLLSRHHHLTQSTDLSLHQETSVPDHGGRERLIPDIGDTDLLTILIIRYGEPALRIGHGERLPFPDIMDGGSDDGFLCILIKYDGL